MTMKVYLINLLVIYLRCIILIILCYILNCVIISGVFPPLTGDETLPISINSCPAPPGSHVWPSALFTRNSCRHTACCFTALILKESLQGGTCIPLPGIYLHVKSPEMAERDTVYGQRTFLGGDPHLGVPHSPGLTETKGNHNNRRQGRRLTTSPDRVKIKPSPTHQQSAFAQTKLWKPNKLFVVFMWSSLGELCLWEKNESFFFFQQEGDISICLCCLAHFCMFGMLIAKPAALPGSLTCQHSTAAYRSNTPRGWLCNNHGAGGVLILQGSSVHVCAQTHTHEVKDLLW